MRKNAWKGVFRVDSRVTQVKKQTRRAHRSKGLLGKARVSGGNGQFSSVTRGSLAKGKSKIPWHLDNGLTVALQGPSGRGQVGGWAGKIGGELRERVG